jgi:hypothetical protein
MCEPDLQGTVPHPEIMPEAGFVTISSVVSKPYKTVSFHILQTLPKLGTVSSLTTRKKNRLPRYFALFGEAKRSQLAIWYFFFRLGPCQKKLDHAESIFW